MGRYSGRKNGQKQDSEKILWGLQALTKCHFSEIDWCVSRKLKEDIPNIVDVADKRKIEVFGNHSLFTPPKV